MEITQERSNLMMPAMAAYYQNKNGLYQIGHLTQKVWGLTITLSTFLGA